jgi:argininosuccinate lyase
MLHELSLEDLQSVEPRITKQLLGLLSPEHSVTSRTSLGGTAPANVKKAIKDARKRWG